MKTAIAALFLLALAPVSASAESEFRECMKMEQLMDGRSNMLFGARAGNSENTRVLNQT